MNRFILATGLATALVVAVTGGSLGRETVKTQTAASITTVAPVSAAAPVSTDAETAVDTSGCR